MIIDPTPGRLYVMSHKAPWNDRGGVPHVHVTRLVARITRRKIFSVWWETAKVLNEYDRPPADIARDIRGGCINLVHAHEIFSKPHPADIADVSTMVGDVADYNVMRRMGQRKVLTGKGKGTVRTLAQQVVYLEKVRRIEES